MLLYGLVDVKVRENVIELIVEFTHFFLERCGRAPCDMLYAPRYGMTFSYFPKHKHTKRINKHDRSWNEEVGTTTKDGSVTGSSLARVSLFATTPPPEN